MKLPPELNYKWTKWTENSDRNERIYVLSERRKKAHNILWLFRISIQCGAAGNNIEKNYANIVCKHLQSIRSSPPTPTLNIYTSSYCIVTISLLLYYIHPWYEIPHSTSATRTPFPYSLSHPKDNDVFLIIFDTILQCAIYLSD